jgi:DNA-binding NarL/FixJ family response regulator
MMINILIVDDHVLFREGLSSLFRSQSDFNVMGEAGSVREAITLALHLRPDVILMDFSMPDGTGLDATREILVEHPKAKIVFLTMHEDDERLFAAIRAGAKGFLVKNIPVTQLLEMLRGLQAGEAPISRSMTTRILEAFSHTDSQKVDEGSALEQLTDREKEVLIEMGRGGTNREIANRLFISDNTVKNHIHNILEKLGLSNRREVIRYAQQRGLISAPPPGSSSNNPKR